MSRPGGGLVIESAEFVCSTHAPKDFPAPLGAEVGFIGRSNVGKSSLLNALVGHKQLARVSSQPGRTRSINFYLVNGRLYFVDLPGYGYARVSREERKQWKISVESYLNQRRLTVAVVIVDARIGPQEGDLMMAEWLRSRRLQWLTVVTKSDKLSRNQLQKCLPEYAQRIDVPLESLVPLSVKTGEGLPILKQKISQVLGPRTG
jgi:GTP-binding protein